METEKASAAAHRGTPDADGSSQQQRRTCTACKASKVKCDRAAPTCGRCARLKLTCVQQPRSQGRPTKYSEAAEPAASDRALSATLKPSRMSSIEASTQWAADYMAVTFSNLLKAGAVHRYKTFAVLRVWMLFSLYYGVDLTRGFLSVALALMDATIQDLQRLPEVLLDTPALQLTPEPSQPPLDPAVLQPFIASLDDGVSAVICCVGCRGGAGKILCNDKFRTTFFSSEDVTFRTLNESTLPVFMYACIIAPEDRAEFVDSLTNMCFGTQTGAPQVTHIVKVVDKAGNEFLAIVRLRCLTLNNGDYGADILTIEPAPSSKYVLQSTEGAGPPPASAGPTSLPSPDSSSASLQGPPPQQPTRGAGPDNMMYQNWDSCERPSATQPPPVASLMPSVPSSSGSAGGAAGNKGGMRRMGGSQSGRGGDGPTPPPGSEVPPPGSRGPQGPPAGPPPPQVPSQPSPSSSSSSQQSVPVSQGLGPPGGEPPMPGNWQSFLPRYQPNYAAQAAQMAAMARGGGGGGPHGGQRNMGEMMMPPSQGVPYEQDAGPQPGMGRMKRPLPDDPMGGQPMPNPQARMAMRGDAAAAAMAAGQGMGRPGVGVGVGVNVGGRDGPMGGPVMPQQQQQQQQPQLSNVGQPYPYYRGGPGGMPPSMPPTMPGGPPGAGGGQPSRGNPYMTGPSMDSRLRMPNPDGMMDSGARGGMPGMPPNRGGGMWGMDPSRMQPQPQAGPMGHHQPPPPSESYESQLSWILGSAPRDMGGLGDMGQGQGKPGDRGRQE